MMKLKLFEQVKKKKNKRPEICLSLSCGNIYDAASEIAEFGEFCQIIEWCADKMDGAENYTKETFIIDAEKIKKLCNKKKLIIDYKGDEVMTNKILRWSMDVADIIDIDAGNPELERLVREAKRKRVETLISYHVFDHMPSRNEIAEQYLKMEKRGGDILKIACTASNEVDTYAILEGAASYSQLRAAKPIVAIAMGEEGQVSRICAGDFGSTISWACGSIPTAPGQFNARQLAKYMDNYYKEEK
ncbi:MAG: type I 3-dehydroquinate dehydratase [Firmicutes bacterium]|nr:type I 3-dehydroquinate dehydratase [Bacillota bacterium]